MQIVALRRYNMKKIFVGTLILIIIVAFSTSVFAGKTGGAGRTGPDSAAGTRDNVLPGNASEGGVVGIQKSNASESDVKETTEDEVVDAALKEFEDAVRSILKNGQAIDNGDFIMTITRPENDKDSTYYKTYNVTGINDYNDLVVSIFRYDENINEYVPMTNTDGQSSWDCLPGLFSKDIELEIGANKIMIHAYRKSEMIASGLQVNCFTIERLPEEIAERVVKNQAKKRQQNYRLSALQ